MRKWLMLPILGLIVACGGGSGLGRDDFTYPFAKSLRIEFKNTTNIQAKLWAEPDETEPASQLGTNDVRVANVTRTWDTEGTSFVFTFKGREGAGPIQTATITVNGFESHAQNFEGFSVQWKRDSITGITGINAEKID